VSLHWIKEFVNLSGYEMLPFTSGILMAALSSNFFEEDKKKTLTDDEYKGSCSFHRISSESIVFDACFRL
jgi:hypothetical protein